jgi:hypothetical protein
MPPHFGFLNGLEFGQPVNCEGLDVYIYVRVFSGCQQ